MDAQSLDVSFTITPSTPFLTLHLVEVGGPSYVEFVARYAKESRYERVRGIFERAISGRMLHAGSEAPSAPAIGFLVDSDWLRQVNALQAKYFPDYPDNFKDMKHFYFRGHDATVEVLAENVRFETVESLDW